MTREEAIRCLNVHSSTNGSGLCTDEQHYKAKQMAIQALSQEPCDDAISRDWLKTAIHNFYDGLKHTPSEEDIQAYIDAAPSVTQKSKTGHWIGYCYQNYGCSECSYIIADSDVEEYNYCPNCGAKMESEDKE